MLMYKHSDLLVEQNWKVGIIMADTQKASDKIKLLDQMLEDIAGDEFDEFSESDSSYSSGNKRFAADDDLSDIDNIH